MEYLNLPYILLIATIFTSFISKSRNIVLLLALFASLSALMLGIIELAGLGSIAAFTFLCHFYFSQNEINKYVKFLFFFSILLFALAFANHIAPGFHNFLALDRVRLSESSALFSMYLNFDKTIAAIIIFTLSGLASNEKPFDKDSLIPIHYQFSKIESSPNQ